MLQCLVYNTICMNITYPIQVIQVNENVYNIDNNCIDNMCTSMIRTSPASMNNSLHKKHILKLHPTNNKLNVRSLYGKYENIFVMFSVSKEKRYFMFFVHMQSIVFWLMYLMFVVTFQMILAS